MSGKAIRETVGLLGVVASLIFVGLEVRANTIAARASAYQEMGSAVQGLWFLAVQDPVLADITMRFFEVEGAEFTPTEETLMVAQTVAAFRQWETTWRQVQLRLLEPEALEQMGWNAAGSDAFAANMRKIWPRVAPLMSPDFLAFLETQLGIE
jgi:hypothetical protein